MSGVWIALMALVVGGLSGGVVAWLLWHWLDDRAQRGEVTFRRAPQQSEKMTEHLLRESGKDRRLYRPYDEGKVPPSRVRHPRRRNRLQ